MKTIPIQVKIEHNMLLERQNYGLRFSHCGRLVTFGPCSGLGWIQYFSCGFAAAQNVY